MASNWFSHRQNLRLRPPASGAGGALGHRLEGSIDEGELEDPGRLRAVAHLAPAQAERVAVDELSITPEVVGYTLGVGPAGAVRAGVAVAMMGKAHRFTVHTTFVSRAFVVETDDGRGACRTAVISQSAIAE
jgi:hypothetical protein